MSSGIENSYYHVAGTPMTDAAPSAGSEDFGRIGKRLIVFCDGSGKAFDQDILHNLPTNIARLAMAVKPDDGEIPQSMSMSSPGVIR
jgi:hypothetical protein